MREPAATLAAVDPTTERYENRHTGVIELTGRDEFLRIRRVYRYRSRIHRESRFPPYERTGAPCSRRSPPNLWFDTEAEDAASFLHLLKLRSPSVANSERCGGRGSRSSPIGGLDGAG